ncbi:hypothetical protein B0H13DRAFT_2382244 [Mycena leptocephala]|nr:hypothetical protein B0H13DRAFT_2382244 [Mycena leptocephala]
MSTPPSTCVVTNLKCARTDDEVEPNVGRDPVLMLHSWNYGLRVAQLEAEVADLRRQLIANQLATKEAMQDLRQELTFLQVDFTGWQAHVGGLRGHIDEVVARLPDHHGWRSEVGSDLDLDTTLAAEFEDGSQPLDRWNWTTMEFEDEKKADIAV